MLIDEEFWQEPDPISRTIPTESIYLDQFGSSHQGEINFRRWEKTIRANPKAQEASFEKPLKSYTLDEEELHQQPSIDDHEIEHLSILKKIMERVDNPIFAVEPLTVINVLSDLGALLLNSEATRDLGTEVIDTFGSPQECSDAIGNCKMISRRRTIPGIDLKQIGTKICEIADTFRSQMSYQTRLIQSQEDHPLDDWDEVAFDEPTASSFLAARERMYKIRQENNRLENTCQFLQRLLDDSRKVRDNLSAKIEKMKKSEIKTFESLTSQYASQGDFTNPPKHLCTVIDEKHENQSRKLEHESLKSQRNGLSFD